MVVVPPREPPRLKPGVLVLNSEPPAAAVPPPVIIKGDEDNVEEGT